MLEWCYRLKLTVQCPSFRIFEEGNGFLKWLGTYSISAKRWSDEGMGDCESVTFKNTESGNQGRTAVDFNCEAWQEINQGVSRSSVLLKKKNRKEEHKNTKDNVWQLGWEKWWRGQANG